MQHATNIYDVLAMVLPMVIVCLFFCGALYLYHKDNDR